MEEKLPFRVEYAKSGRAGCKGCKTNITKDSIRLAVMVQSPFFDGMQPNWYHFSCFFGKFRPKSTADIAHFESIRWDDQETIKKEMEKHKGTSVPANESGTSKKSKKRNNQAPVNIPEINDYTIEYAKSRRAKCKVCEENIEKDEIRISKKDYESEIAMKYGPVERWHHVDCFIKAREELNYFASGEFLPGFKTMTAEDQKVLKQKIPEIAGTNTTDGPSVPKKIKEDEDNSLKMKLKKQNDTMFKYHDLLESLKKSELQLLLEYNNQEVPEGVSRMLDRLSDAMTFGALEKCKNCKGQLTFSSGTGYTCLGYVNEWLKCESVLSKPPRFPFKVPSELKEDYTFLNKYKGKVIQRLFTSGVKSNTTPETEKKVSVLDSYKFFIHKTKEKKIEEIKELITDLGGIIVKKYEDDVLAVISTQAEMEKKALSKSLKCAQTAEIPVLPENFFDGISAFTSREDLFNKISDKKISSWNFDLNKKIKKIKEEPVKKSVYPVKESNSKSMFKSNETVKKVTLKDGLIVDPDSKLDKVAHVYRKGNDTYSCVLSLADIQTGKNSYYKMQILESDKKNKYWLFKAWGRIGTTIGGNKCDQYATLNDCIDIFKETFEEQTGNKWKNRKNFKKVPGKKIMLDIDNNENKDVKEFSEIKMESSILSQSVQNLVKFIFDIEAMKRTMMEFELDLNKMPLGKISRKQIHKAYEILSKLQTLANEKAKRHELIENSNKFYTLVPHDFGINSPPLLDNKEIILQKIDMLNSLLDIEIAYNLLQECDNTIDEHYKKLNTNIVDLDENSEEYKMIKLYVKNTHAKTHMNYTLEIENIFKIERNGESERYSKHSSLSNKRLLWHGSRVTNIVGILSQGLRIAPPEAPVTGYMFGKGIYFADMVSKSANYCNTTKKNNIGLLLLCEVALGEMLELTNAEYIEKLPAGKHSVKGVGRTHPDPSQVSVTPSGAVVPFGKGIDANVKKSSLLYNEYIVYDVSQVKIEYLLRLKFNHKM